MKIVTLKDGGKGYRFEEGEANARKIFEEGLMAEDEIDRMMEALAKATTMARRRSINAWRSIRHAIHEIDPDLGPIDEEVRVDAVYNWLTSTVVMRPTTGISITIEEKGNE